MRAKHAEEKRGVSPLLVFLIVVLVAALAAGGLLAWQFLGTNLVAAQATDRERAALAEQWAQPLPSAPETDPEAAPVVEQPTPHEVAWLLRIPSLDLDVPVIAGVEPDDLNRGVGWYPGTALPGQVGNVAFAGFRAGNGEPFRRLLELREGDEVIVETRTAMFTYTVVSPPGNLTVQADDSWVIDPVPGQPDAAPTEALLTLTTAEDLVDSPDRAVGFATLTSTEKT